MNKSSVNMGSGGGGLFSSSSSSSACYSSCNSGSVASASNSSVAGSSQVRCDCVKCTYCQNALGSISIKCSECVNFHLCLKCFSMSAEIGEHKKDHNYMLKSLVSFPLFDSEKLWTYKEELHLLQFIEQYGFDNWEEIGKHLPNRTAEECMQHYHSYYIYGNLGKNTFTTNLKNKLEAVSLESELKSEPHEQKSEIATTVLLPPLEMSIEEQRALGYMPFRDDFEREYKNDGEQLLSNMNIANNQLVLLNNNINIEKLTSGQTSSTPPTSSLFSTPSKQQDSSKLNLDADDVVDFDLKLTLIEMYRECLQERQRHKKIAREYGLVNSASGLLNKQKVVASSNVHSSSGILLAPNGLSYNHVSNRKRIKKVGIQTNDKDMTGLNEKLKKYAQFMPVSDYETLLENLRKQRQIYKKIQELEAYRSNYGMQKLADIEAFKKEQLAKTPMVKSIKRKRKSYQLFAESPNKRLTRRQNTSNVLMNMSGKLDSTLNDTNLTDLNISNIRNFSPTSSTNSSRSNSTNRSRSNSRSNSTNSMNMYELVEQNKPIECHESLVTDDQDDQNGSENDENHDNDQIYTDEDENEISEDLSSGGAASSGGSGINEPDASSVIPHVGRRLRTLNNRRNNSLLVKKSKKLNLSLNNSNTANKSHNSSLSKSNIKRTNMLLKTAKAGNAAGNKIISKKLKLLDMQRNGRSERLCSMPGYNLLSENEKKLVSSVNMKPTDYINLKTNLIKNNLARRNHTKKAEQQDMSNYLLPFPKNPGSPEHNNLNETCPNPSTTPSKVTSMMLRRHSLSNIEPENIHQESSQSTMLNNHIQGAANALISTSSTITTAETNHRFKTLLMNTTCPKFKLLPKSSRKRILRFLCDNGWIDVS